MDEEKIAEEKFEEYWGGKSEINKDIAREIFMAEYKEGYIVGEDEGAKIHIVK